MFSDVLLDCVQIADFDFFLMKTYNLGRVRSGRSEVRDVAQRFFSGLDIFLWAGFGLCDSVFASEGFQSHKRLAA